MTDPRYERSRRALMQTAIGVFLENPTASMTDIAREAGIGRATLYRHFKSREELVQALALESLQITNELLQPIEDLAVDAGSRIQQGLRAVMQAADRFHFLLLLWNISSQDAAVMKIYQQQLDSLSSLIDAGKKEGSIDETLDTLWIIYLVDSLVYAGWWAVREKTLTSEQAGEHAAKVLFRGIGTQ